MALCLSVGGPSIYSADKHSNKVFIGTVNGIFVIERTNGRWSIQNKKMDGRHIHGLLVVPDSEYMFAGVHKGSVYGSRDYGDTWELKSRGLSENNVYSLNCAVVHDKLKLYGGTEPAHLYESDDLGATWTELTSLRTAPSVCDWTFPAPPHQAHIKYIGFDPYESKTIYACVEQGGLFRSRDGGRQWEELHGFDINLPFEIPEGAAANDVHRILIKRSDPNCLYISGGVGIWASRDGGTHWTNLLSPHSRIGYPDALLIHPQREDLMFTAGAAENPKSWRVTRDANAAIARSRDGGESWEILRQGLPGHMRSHVAAMAMEVRNGSCELFAGTTSGEIFYSGNEGDSWAKIIDVEPISKAGHYISLGEKSRLTVA